jgi:hypothetical protein
MLGASLAYFACDGERRFRLSLRYEIYRSAAHPTGRAVVADACSHKKVPCQRPNPTDGQRRSRTGRCAKDPKSWPAQLPLLASRKAIILARSSAEVRPPYGFILLPGTTWSGLAMKRSSVALSHVKSASLMALE